MSNTFKSNASLKLTKNEAKVKQHTEAELLLIENYLLSLCIHPKIIADILKKYKKQMPLFKCGYMINGNENETEIEK